MSKRDKLPRPAISGTPNSSPQTQTPSQSDFNPSVRQQSTISVTTTEMSHAGPLPHPAILRQYDQAVPGLAERIAQMAESQAAHRMKLEEESLKADIESHKKQIRLSTCGQLSSFIIAMTAIVASAYVALRGQPWVGGIVGTGGLGGLIVAILQAIRKGRPDEEK